MYSSAKTSQGKETPSTWAVLCSSKLIIPSRCGDSGAMYIGRAMCSSTQNLLTFSLRSFVFCKIIEKKNEGRCKARRGMNVEINVYQTQKKAVAVNLQQNYSWKYTCSLLKCTALMEEDKLLESSACV